MNKNINLCEILKGHEGETFYSTAYGIVELLSCSNDDIEVYNYARNIKVLYGKYGEIYHSEGECTLFPSKDQRDWNKWVEEQKTKVPKTWKELVYSTKEIKEPFVDVNSNMELQAVSKSAIALIKIHQLIEVSYGGNITNEEWENKETEIHSIGYSYLGDKEFYIKPYVRMFSHIAFHTLEQVKEFLSYEENVQLLNEYFML